MIKTIRVIDNFKDFVRNLTGPITEEQKDLICKHLARYESCDYYYCIESVHGYAEYCIAIANNREICSTQKQYDLVVNAFDVLIALTDPDLYISSRDEFIWS